ncbi:recombinase family protein [Geomicrobium sp. JCM 19038]|uniref:recombinase family protein n=1 Tax=Geomicrobium sp. JCM 19038 TaxID=1460635 RepID=UPI00045F4C81|nr:recombinase family protein [Geomicrobium sp. JCM 19038]GAK07309.1 resolvase [Geomicrobium sp. JCM 19038]
MIYGYVRPYSRDEEGWLQNQLLEKYGVNTIVQEGDFGEGSDEELLDLIEQLQPKDTVVVVKLSCLATSSELLLETLTYFDENNIRFISLFDEIDTLRLGSVYLNAIKRMDEFAFDVRSERTRLGIKRKQKINFIYFK